ncbi:MAG: lysoplasmalogenase [Chloroflexi bacterium]|nr:lysoplasmalogenase [Chloroflexota bacterium]
MYFLLILAIAFAALEAYATNKGLLKIEFIAKPAVMICLFIWLLLETGLQGAALWFGLGVLFSLAGDTFLLWLDRMFIFGLISFLFAHIFYIIGFKDELAAVSMWSLLLAVILGVSAVRVMRRIITSIRAKGQTRMAVPVIVYAAAISVMLYAAMLTLFDVTWNASASLLVAAGAFFFFVSDIVLAWNKFVSPITKGRMLNIGLYHLGQILLVSGVITQFS